MFFTLMDEDNDNGVTMDEFLEGCLRLKGHARSLDVNILLYTMKRLFTLNEINQRLPQSQVPEGAQPRRRVSGVGAALK